jgi:WD40 repeat protein
MDDGKSIVTGWNDGKIRAYTPETGKLMYTIHDAHNSGVTAIATTSNCHRIVSGGGEGQVRVWDVVGNSTKMKAAMKEHRGTVSCIKVRSNDLECVSASADGTCIIWNLHVAADNRLYNSPSKEMSSERETSNVEQLELESTVGFNGHIPGGLYVHPDRSHIIYAIGCNVVVEEIASHKQTFLSGHTNQVSCLAVSKSGRFVASGQVTHMGFIADIIVWDYEKKERYATFKLHKVKVEAVAFSPGEHFLVSLGGRDDNSVAIWDLAKKEAVCGSPAAMKSAGCVFAVAFANQRDDIFVTGGE